MRDVRDRRGPSRRPAGAFDTYAKSDFPTDAVYGDIDHAGLRLITCGGAFDEATGNYRSNVVVFARLTGWSR